MYLPGISPQTSIGSERSREREEEERAVQMGEFKPVAVRWGEFRPKSKEVMAPAVQGDFDCGGVRGLELRKSKGKREKQVREMSRSERAPSQPGQNLLFIFLKPKNVIKRTA